MKSIYLDTTIPSFLFDTREEMKFLIEITKKWWHEEQSSFHIYVSDETIRELSEGNYPNKEKILDFALKIDILPYAEEIVNIAESYSSNNLMPKKELGDAIHLAYASYYKIDYLLTWNCNHLANANKKPHIRFLNTKLGLFIPEIITPMELFKEE